MFLTTLTQKDKNDLQKLQNKILRCCLNIVDPMDMNVLEMHNIVNVDMVDKRRTINLLTIVQNGVINNKFNMLNHDVRTRHNVGYKIELIKPRNEYVRKSCFYVGTFNWNNLPLDIRNLDLQHFKSKIKETIRTGEIPNL